MRKFAVKNPVRGNKTIAYLYYDEIRRAYRIEVPENVKSVEAPPIISDFIRKGKRCLDEVWSLRWVQQRVIPPERQNIGQILRENGMQAYDEFTFLIMNRGRSCQDECYLEEMKGDETI